MNLKGLVRIVLLIVAIVSLMGCQEEAFRVPLVDNIEADHAPRT